MSLHDLPSLRGQTEYGKLVIQMARLAYRLDRPVSTRDLRKHFQEHPEDRPLLMGGLGILVCKAVRRVNQSGVQLVPIGVFANAMHYAPDDNPRWISRFQRFTSRNWLAKQVARDLPGHAGYLLGSRHEGLAINALAGWLKEMSMQLDIAETEASAYPHLPEMLDRAAVIDAPTFTGMAPGDLINRRAAVTALKAEIAVRTPWRAPNRVNWGRYLVQVRWPQSILFDEPPLSWACSRWQLQCLIASRWPLADENPVEAAALTVCLGYGAGGLLLRRKLRNPPQG